MTRIIAGSAGGRRLQAPPGRATRPTSDRVREALFSRLEHLDAISSARVLDLYAGSGALGLEAASRGAGAVTLVESAGSVARVADRNARLLGLPGVQVRSDPVERVVAVPPSGGPYDLVLADPPYDLAGPALAKVLGLLAEHGWLAHEALVVVERAARSGEPAWPAGLEPLGPRRYGDTVLWFAQWEPPPG